MKFSIFYFADAASDRPDGVYGLLFEGARFADENGFEAVWTPERHFHPFGGPYANPSVTGSAIAAVTQRVQVRAGSVVAPLHHPLRIAEEWSMVDNLSRGRAGVAFASGWNPVDFAFRPEAYGDRARVVVETIAQVRSFWAGEPALVRGGDGELHRVQLHPRPVQAELPIWMTSAGGRQTFETAGRLGAGVLTHLVTQDIDELATKIASYRRAAEATPDRQHVVVMLHTLLGTDSDHVMSMVRPPMTEYLRSSLNLMASTGSSRDLDPVTLDESVNELLEQACDRYLGHCGLFGTVEDGRDRVEQLRRAGVDEIACLIDFGLPDSTVVGGFKFLKRLKDLYEG